MAKLRNIKVTIKKVAYIDLFNANIGCTYCGADLSQSSGHCLDRLDNRKGYTPSNTLPCCGVCNSFKGDYLTEYEMREVIKVLKKTRTNQPIWDKRARESRKRRRNGIKSTRRNRRSRRLTVT
jgi:hypothetical protein